MEGNNENWNKAQEDNFVDAFNFAALFIPVL